MDLEQRLWLHAGKQTSAAGTGQRNIERQGQVDLSLDSRTLEASDVHEERETSEHLDKDWILAGEKEVVD